MHYERHLDPDGDDSLARLARRVPAGCRVLELGPATGYFSRHLHEHLGCTVDAIELSAEMAHHARPWCRNLYVCDIEQIDLASTLGTTEYDVILCADVLEHLRDPWTLARRLAGHLAPDGRLLLSVPNAGYLGLLIDLLRGNFRYRDEGLMDRSHLRFFTLGSLRELLEAAGWRVWEAEGVPLALTDSEFRVRLETLNPVLRDELLARSDALFYQWIVDARRGDPPHPASVPQTRPDDRFQVRVFWRRGAEVYDDARNRLAWGALGRERQTLALDFPDGQEGLALRLSDRPGFVRLRTLRLIGGESTVWSWAADKGPLPVVAGIETERAGDDGLWFVNGTRARLELALPMEAVRGATRIEVRLDSPLSADFLAARAYWEDPAGLPAELAECRRRCERIASVRAVLGEDESDWPRQARLLRAAQRIPGLEALVDWLAARRASTSTRNNNR